MIEEYLNMERKLNLLKARMVEQRKTKKNSFFSSMRNKIKYRKLNTDLSQNKIQLNNEYILLKNQDALISTQGAKKMLMAAYDNHSDVVFCDSIINNKVHLKSAISVDLLLQGNEEYDVLLISNELYNIILEFIGNEGVISNVEFIFASFLLTKDIYHLEEPLYKIKKIEKEKNRITDFYNHLIYRDRTENPKISIVIPTKDKVDLLNNCIDSILNKTIYNNYEILIINNRSEETQSFKYFNDIKENCKIKVIDADIDFNWSKLNNIGISNSDADIFVFLNNDTLVIDGEWLDYIIEDCTRNDVGVVGGLLLYEDGTIQHAGVVVGLIDFADHLYKGKKPDTKECAFYSPLVKRNVLAVTGACMSISKKAIEKIGLFDEEFIICGSDVEMCIRSYEHHLNNIYDPRIKLYHLESKSRDSYIPPIDFEMSQIHYEPYRSKGDPFYNKNLDKKSVVPKLKGE